MHELNNIPDKMHKFAEKDEAVSPVVGVMLMLVVTIIIAAVVSSFSSGITQTTSKAPTAAYQFDINGNYMTPGVGFPIEMRLIAGDTLPSSELKIVTEYTVPDTWHGTELADAGKVIKHIIDGSIMPTNGGTGLVASKGVNTNLDGYPYVTQTTAYPYFLMPNTNGFGNSAVFGICDIKPNEVYKFSNPDQFLGFDIDDTKYGLSEGSIVHITVIHSPTNSILYDKDVSVKW